MKPAKQWLLNELLMKAEKLVNPMLASCESDASGPAVVKSKLYITKGFGAKIVKVMLPYKPATKPETQKPRQIAGALLCQSRGLSLRWGRPA